MGILVVLLIAAWGFVLAPAVLQAVGNSPLNSEAMFRRALHAMGKRPRHSVLGGRSILVPPKTPYPGGSAPIGHLGGPSDELAPAGSRPSASERRRRNLTYMAIFIIVTFLLGLIPALRFLLVVNLVADVLLVVYLAAAFYFSLRPPSASRSPSTVSEEDLPAGRVAG